MEAATTGTAKAVERLLNASVYGPLSSHSHRHTADFRRHHIFDSCHRPAFSSPATTHHLVCVCVHVKREEKGDMRKESRGNRE